MAYKLVGNNMEDFGNAILNIVPDLNRGASYRVTVCTSAMPTENDLAKIVINANNGGYSTSFPVYSLINGNHITQFILSKKATNRTVGVRSIGLIPAIIPIIVPLAVIGLVAFGITQIKKITSSLLPILLIGVAGITVLAIAFKKPAEAAATTYLQKQRLLPMNKRLQGYMPETELLPSLRKLETQMQFAKKKWDATPRLAREAILRSTAYPLSEAVLSWDELREDRKIWILEYHYKEKYPEEIAALKPYKKQAFGLTSGAPPSIEEKGILYNLENSFPTRMEANEEAQTFRDRYYRTIVRPFGGQYLVYASDIPKYEEKKKKHLPETYFKSLRPWINIDDEVLAENAAGRWSKGKVIKVLDDIPERAEVLLEGNVEVLIHRNNEGVSWKRTGKAVILRDLNRSLDEEIKAELDYKYRSKVAKIEGDTKTAELYDHIYPEEIEHSKEIKERIKELGGNVIYPCTENYNPETYKPFSHSDYNEMIRRLFIKGYGRGPTDEEFLAFKQEVEEDFAKEQAEDFEDGDSSPESLYVTITDSGDTVITEGSVISIDALEKENERVKKLGLKPAIYYIPPSGAEIDEEGGRNVPGGGFFNLETNNGRSWLPDSPEYMAETLERDGWRDKIDLAFSERINELKVN